MERRILLRIGLLALAFTGLLIPSGCGGDGRSGIVECSNIVQLAVAPGNVVMDHSPPGNQWTFIAFGVYDRSSGCLDHVAPALDNTSWSVSDPNSVSLAAGPGTDKVTATCLTTTSTPVTMTVTSQLGHNTVTGIATLICK